MLTWTDIIEFGERGTPSPDRRVERSDEEWRALLTPEGYRVTRQGATEAPFSSTMCRRIEPGQ